MDFSDLRCLVIFVLFSDLVFQNLLESLISKFLILHLVVQQEFSDELEVCFLVLNFRLSEIDSSVDSGDQVAPSVPFLAECNSHDEISHLGERRVANLNDLYLWALFPGDIFTDFLVQFPHEFD